MNGKGSNPRPLSVSKGEFDRRWEETFDKSVEDVYAEVILFGESRVRRREKGKAGKKPARRR